jgi:hypothetical protein
MQFRTSFDEFHQPFSDVHDGIDVMMNPINQSMKRILVLLGNVKIIKTERLKSSRNRVRFPPTNQRRYNLLRYSFIREKL